jgi:hypothetical protein
MARRHLRVLPGVLAAVLTAACGTTVPGASSRGPGTGALQAGQGSSAATGLSGAPGEPPAAAPAADAGLGPQRNAVPGLPASTGTTTSAEGPATADRTSAGGTPALARGVTATSVVIDVMASKTLAAGFAAFGAAGAPPDPTPQINALTAYVNAHGGLKGKKVQIHFTWRDDTNTAQNFSAQDQAMCADMTQDNKVFLVVSAYSAHGLVPCLAKAGVPLVESGGGPPHYGVTQWDRAGALYQTPNQMSACRYTRVLVGGLVKQGYFNGAKKIGLPYMANDYMKNAVQRCLLPAMKEHGLPAPEIAEYTPLERPTDYSQTETEAANSVLQYKADGVTHVLFLDDQSTTFIDAAKSQAYHPHYGYGSLSVPASQAVDEGSELIGSMAVGISPPVDVAPENLPTPVSANETLCRKIMTGAGLADQVADPTTWAVMRFHCEGFFFLQAAMSRAPSLSVEGFTRGAAALGSGYLPTTTYGYESGPGRYDGAATARPLAYVDSCTCTRYSGPAYRVP